MVIKFNKIKYLYKRSEAFLSSVKFAVIIISLFAISLAVGTFFESYHGTLFANKVIYKSWWFMGIQLAMFLSIIMATVVRLPAKKVLYGFYTVHLGLVILFLGSFITYVVGIDGTIQLLPNKPARKILINEDQIKVHNLENNKVYTEPLPYTGYPAVLNSKLAFEDILLLDYYPSATSNLIWEKNQEGVSTYSTQYLIFNENVSQEIILSLNPVSDYQSSQKLGPLTAHLMPLELKECFLANSASGLIIWYTKEQRCSTPEKEKIEIKTSEKGSRVLTFVHQEKTLRFLPEFTPLPIDEDLQKDQNSPVRVLSLDLFTKKPHLFSFGNEIVYYKKRGKKWVTREFGEQELLRLPWMGFSLKRLKSTNSHYPLDIPAYVKPIQDNNKIILGEDQAMKLTVGGNEYWITDKKPLQLSSLKGNLFIQFVKKTFSLPYQITLEKFVMRKNPGTNDPASFESHVELLDGRTNDGVKKFHVFMNNPLKYDSFTYYQSSYFPIGVDDKGEQSYASVFSVNYDPGRKFKYLGSLLIVLGSMWHFYIRRRKKRVKA